MVSLKNISKKFGSTQVLHDISFTIPEGEVVGFLGPNGAGKTTTMRLIVGFLVPSSGTVSVDGANPILERVKVLQTIGYLAENNPLYEDMKVEEYLQFIVDAKAGVGINMHDIIGETGVEDVMHQSIEKLSRGYKQRVGLTAALIGNPRILILDEPTSGLDPLEQEKIRNLIKKLGKRRTIIVSTHSLPEVEDIATKLIIINKGRIVFDDYRPEKPGGVEQIFKKLITKPSIYAKNDSSV